MRRGYIIISWIVQEFIKVAWRVFFEFENKFLLQEMQKKLHLLSFQEKTKFLISSLFLLALINLRMLIYLKIINWLKRLMMFLFGMFWIRCRKMFSFSDAGILLTGNVSRTKTVPLFVSDIQIHRQQFLMRTVFMSCGRNLFLKK